MPCELRVCIRIFIEGCPVIQAELLAFCLLLIFLDALNPVIRLLNHAELHRRIGAADFIQVDFAQEEADVIIRVVIQPLNRRAVFLACVLYHPDNRLRIFPGSVGDKFAQMVVVGIFQLVFDDNLLLRCNIGRDNIHAEIAHSRFCSVDCNFHADFIAQNRDVLILRQPRRKIQCFMRPNLPQILHFGQNFKLLHRAYLLLCAAYSGRLSYDSR